MKTGLNVWTLVDSEWTRGVVESTEDANVQVRLPNDERIQVEIPNEKRILPASALDTDLIDVAKVEFANIPSMVEVLRVRYEQGLIFTNAGNTLMSVNPFEQTQLFTEDVMDAYMAGQRDPHLFLVGMSAVQKMYAKKQVNSKNLTTNQAIVISGESGAGKSECVKYLMSFMAHLSAREMMQTDNAMQLRRRSSGEEAKRKILESSPILESFGNATTTKNSNSSRVGKFIQLRFTIEHGLSGAQIETCLLETVRLVSHSKNERNFHIFYQLCAGLPQELQQKYRLKAASHYQYLNQGQAADNDQDKVNFQLLVKALTEIGFSTDRQENLFRILIGIVQLGNVKLDSTLEEGSCGSSKNSLRILEIKMLEKIAEHFGIGAEDLHNAICTRLIKAGTEYIPKDLSTEQALSCKNSIAKTIYSRIFTWLVHCINISIAHDRANMSIGILDIFGFEVSKYHFMQ